MSWRGTIRALEAASRRSQREHERERKRLLAREMQIQKMDALTKARHEVELHENLIANLLSLHKQCADPVDWKGLSSKNAPEVPVQKQDHELAARDALNKYRPTILDRILGRIEKKRAALERDIELERQRDQDEFKVAMSKHGDEIAEWEAARKLAEGVLRGDIGALAEAIRYSDPFSDVRDLGSEIKVAINPGPVADAVFHANGPSVVPNHTKSLMRNGTVNEKKMPQGAYWKLYQDYVCGCALRIGRELFSLLPIDEAIVTATAEVLNTSTGHMENAPILSALLVRKTMAGLNFENIDCSDAFRNFVHNMGFKRNSGLSAVEKVAPK